MKHRIAAVPLFAALALSGVASADTLLVERVQEENQATLPTRGGAPRRRRAAGNQIGGGSGKKIATAAGAVGGAVAGRKVQENQQNKTETVVERRCD